MENNSRFQLKDGRIIRVHERPNVCFLTVLSHAGKFAERFDVVVFQPPAFPLEVDMPVTISGDLGMRKPKPGEQGKWEIQLIARKIEKGDADKAPWPKGQTKAAPKPAPVVDESDDLLF